MAKAEGTDRIKDSMLDPEVTPEHFDEMVRRLKVIEELDL